MKFHTSVGLASLLAASLVISACNGGGGGGGGSSSPDGSVAFALTDTPSEDVISLQVDVTALSMTRANGEVVDALSAPVRVDFATLSDLSQIIDQSTLPKGAYTKLEIVLDFASARAVLANQTSPATILDTDGNALAGVQAVSIDFATGPFIVVAAQQHVVELDFAIDQSVIVDAVANSIVVEPMFTVRIDNSGPKDLIAFGRLQAVDTSNGTFTVKIETLNGVPLSDVTFQEDASTIFQVDGVPYTGASGLGALSLEPLDTWVQARGLVVGHSSKIRALYVEAGRGTYNGGQDIVEGFVVDRTGGAGQNATLTVLGASTDASHTTWQFHTSFTVDAAFASTHVVRIRSAAVFDLDDVNVGQRVRAYGTLTGTTLDATTSSGILRTLPTPVFGHATSAPSGGVLTLDLARVGSLSESAFNWTAVGSSPVDSTAFAIDSGALAVGQGITSGTAVEAFGFFTAVDDDQEDFDAVAILNLDTAPALLLVRDLVGGFDVATATTSNQIRFTITGAAGAGELAVLDRVFLGTIPLPTAPAPRVLAPTNGQGLYFLKDKDTGAAVFYKHFAAFSDALELKLNGGARITLFGALGAYDSANNTLTATAIVATVE